MANVLSNPYVLDTAGLIDNAFQPRMVKRVVWLSPAATNDTFKLTDAAGVAVIAQGKCEANGQTQTWLVEHAFDGLSLDHLDSGTLFVYFN